MTRTEITNGYLETLGLERADPDLAFLGEISRRHVARFAFSSVGPRLGDPLPLDPASLYERIVVRARGGYCFEQNGLLFEILAELGFEAEMFLARVIYDRDIHPGLTHRIAMVSLDGDRHLVDVGFGSFGPSRPVLWKAGHESKEGRRVFRLAQPAGGAGSREVHLQTLKDGDYFSLYRFDIEARYGQADCELGHFFSHKHPQAVFVNHLVVSRILDDEIRSLRNSDYRIMSEAGNVQRTLESAEELKTLLQEAFALEVSDAESAALFEPAASS